MSDQIRRLDKAGSRARWRELRILWNEFDPIGVVKPAEVEIDDKYESYVGPLIRQLEAGVSQGEIVKSLETLLTEHIGLTWSAELADRTSDFVARSRDWYQTNWANTRV